ncbi:MAG: serine protein kinase RIO [Candidatus Bathyarchaeia archaeon]
MSLRAERKVALREKRYIREQLIKVKRSEELEALEEVFDKSTLMTLYRLLNLNFLTTIHGVVKAGKESKVYWGVLKNGLKVAVKIYLTSSSEFRRGMINYIEGDPRFRRVKRDTRSLIYLWAQKEFKNLQAAYSAGVFVPKPILVEKNVLIMEFIGVDGSPAPLLREVEVKAPTRLYREILNQVKKLYVSAELVHADLSEYNIMMQRGKPFLIDLSQALHREHPSSTMYLTRDLENINKYFIKLGVDVKPVQRILEELKVWPP